MSEVDLKQTPDRHIPERAKELAADVGREVLARANEQGQRGMKAVGEGLSRAAHYVGDNAGTVASEVPGVKREHVDAVAGGLQTAARYLESNDPQSLLVDADGAIRRHPYRAMAVGLGIGYLIGRWMRSDR